MEPDVPMTGQDHRCSLCVLAQKGPDLLVVIDAKPLLGTTWLIVMYL